MSTNLLIAIGIGAFICSLIAFAFIFYRYGKEKNDKINYFTFVCLLFFVITSKACGLGLPNPIQNTFAIIFGNASVALISYYLGLGSRKTSTKKE